MTDKPKPIYIERKEGGELIPFERYVTNGEAHAIFFADGSVFDCYNGWRPQSARLKPIVRVPARTINRANGEPRSIRP